MAIFGRFCWCYKEKIVSINTVIGKQKLKRHTSLLSKQGIVGFPVEAELVVQDRPLDRAVGTTRAGIRS